MTKVKFMLSTIAAISAIGGAFALKAKKIQGLTLYSLREGDFIAKPNPSEPQNCLETIATDGIFTVPASLASYYYVTSTPPTGDTNPCYYDYYLTQE